MEEPTHPLARRSHEPRRAHRALLVFAMCELRRSARNAAKAVGVSETQARKWRNRWNWDERCVGEACEVAWKIYKDVYYPVHLDVELLRVKTSIPSVLTEGLWNDPTYSDYALAAVERTMKTARRKDPEQGAAEVLMAQHMEHLQMLWDAGMNALAQGRVRFTVTDLLHIMKRQESLITARPQQQNSGPAFEESVRVKQARAAGGDVLAALKDDASELSVVLGALNSKQEFDQEVFEATDPPETVVLDAEASED